MMFVRKTRAFNVDEIDCRWDITVSLKLHLKQSATFWIQLSKASFSLISNKQLTNSLAQSEFFVASFYWQKVY